MFYHRSHRSKTSMCWGLVEFQNFKYTQNAITLVCSTGAVPHHNLSSTNFLLSSTPPTLFYPCHLPCTLLGHHLQLQPQTRSLLTKSVRRSCHQMRATLQIMESGLMVRNMSIKLWMRYKTTYLNIRQLKWWSQ